MKLTEQRKIAEQIYKKYHIDVLKWDIGLAAELQSDVPRSFFDFDDSTILASKEIRKRINLFGDCPQCLLNEEIIVPRRRKNGDLVCRRCKTNISNIGTRAVCLVSGGLDSATTMGILLDKGFTVLPVTLNYGQLHERELQSAQDVTEHFAQRYPGQLLPAREFELGFLREIGGSALTEDRLTVPTGRDENEMSDSIPITYVPGRNTIFIAVALSLAEAISADVVALGVNALDYSGYPDCRPEYIKAYNAVAAISSKKAVEGRPTIIYTPLIHMSKAKIIEIGTELEVPYHLTWSCYKGGNVPCGECDSCKLRAKGFEVAGKQDPALSN